MLLKFSAWWCLRPLVLKRHFKTGVLTHSAHQEATRFSFSFPKAQKPPASPAQLCGLSSSKPVAELGKGRQGAGQVSDSALDVWSPLCWLSPPPNCCHSVRKMLSSWPSASVKGEKKDVSGPVLHAVKALTSSSIIQGARPLGNGLFRDCG